MNAQKSGNMNINGPDMNINGPSGNLDGNLNANVNGGKGGDINLNAPDINIGAKANKEEKAKWTFGENYNWNMEPSTMTQGNNEANVNFNGIGGGQEATNFKVEEL